VLPREHLTGSDHYRIMAFYLLIAESTMNALQR